MNGVVSHRGVPLRAEDVKAAMSSDGFYTLSSDTTLEQFRNVAQDLGEVFYEADVCMGGERPRNYQLPAAIDFHTDHISAEIAAWYCVERESEGGAMRFVDLAPVAKTMNEKELDALGRVGVPDNAVWTEGGNIPLCSIRDGRRSFHYVPWLTLSAPDQAARQALAKFKAGISSAKTDHMVEFDLYPGDLVFVDNHRIMHGRRAIPPGSKRNLKRLWIRSSNSAKPAQRTADNESGPA